LSGKVFPRARNLLSPRQGVVLSEMATRRLNPPKLWSFLRASPA